MIIPHFRTTIVALYLLLSVILLPGSLRADIPDEGQERFDVLQQRALEAYQRDALEEALSYYEMLQEMAPDSGEIAYNRGSILLDLQRYEEAITLLSRAIDLPEQEAFSPAPVYHNRALAFTELGEYDRALSDYDRAYELDPNDPRTLNNRGVVLTSMDNLDEAVRSFELARELDPAYLDPYFHLGNIAYDRGDFGLAVERFREALEIDPRFEQARFNLGNAFYRDGRYTEAVDTYVELYIIRRDDAERDDAGEDLLHNLGLSALEAAVEARADGNPD